MLALLGIVEALMATLLAALGAGYAWLRKRMKQDEAETAAIKAAVSSSIRDRIVQAYYFHTDKGYMPIHSRDSVADMHRQYKALGGNGTVATLIERLNALPTEEREGDTK
jgi:uncharacterized membrane protein